MHGCGLVALGGQQEVNRFALLVYRAVKILPVAFDLDKRFIQAPADAHRTLMLAKDFLQQGQKPDRPAVDREMVDKHAALLHHLFEMAKAQWIRRVPTNTHQSDLDWKANSFGCQHRISSLLVKSLSINEPSCLTANATKPVCLLAVSSTAPASKQYAQPWSG